MPSLHLLKELLLILLQGLELLLHLLLEESDVRLELGYGPLRLFSVDTAAAVLAVFKFLLRLIQSFGYITQV